MALFEPVLSDAAPVTSGALYVCDGVVAVSPVTGTVADLRAALGATVVQSIDVPGRRVMMWPPGTADTFAGGDLFGT
jgi:hypothetical protein